MDAKLVECVANNLRGIGPGKVMGFTTRGLMLLARAMDRAALRERRGETLEEVAPVPTEPMTKAELLDLHVTAETFAPREMDDNEILSFEREQLVRDGLIAQIMKAKAERAKIKKAAEAAEAVQAIETQLAGTKLEELEPEAPKAAEDEAPQEAEGEGEGEEKGEEEEEEDVVPPRSGVRVASFNSCRLKSDQLAMHDQVSALAAVLANFDIIVVQEVPPKDDAVDKVSALCDILASQFAAHGRKYRFAISDASGRAASAEFGKEGTYRERHAILVREPFRILSHLELSKLGEVDFDYAPLTVIIQVDEEAEAILGTSRMVVSSIHMPPEKRKEARDAQLTALLAHYPLTAGATSKGKPIHLLAGDFNTHPGKKTDDGKEVYPLEASGWARPLIGSKVATSAGGKALDNFVVDAASEQALHERAQLSAEVLAIDFLSRQATEEQEGAAGLSDHAPIGLVIKKPLSAGVLV